MIITLATPRLPAGLSELSLSFSSSHNHLKARLSPLKPCPLDSAPSQAVTAITAFTHDSTRFLAFSKGRQTSIYARNLPDTLPQSIPGIPDLGVAHSKDYIVYLKEVRGYIVSCSNRGLVTVLKQSMPDLSFWAMVEDPVQFCQNIDGNPFRILVGGYNHPLEIYDFSAQYRTYARRAKTMSSRVPDHLLVALDPLWSSSWARQPHSELREVAQIIEVPVSQLYEAVGEQRAHNKMFCWFQDAVVMAESTRLSDLDLSVWAISKFGELTLYKPHISEVAICKYTVSDNPLQRIFALGNTHLLLLDSHGQVSVFDIDKDEIVHVFNIPVVGLLSSLALVPLDSGFILIIASIMRQLRVYHLRLDSMTLRLLTQKDIGSVVPAMAIDV